VETNANIIFIIAAFGLAVILIIARERIPESMRRSMAILSILLVLFAFFLIVYSFYSAGT
jgi:glucan phosphoethanolaminetransferase (alkaline phosphatase superfamily)